MLKSDHNVAGDHVFTMGTGKVLGRTTAGTGAVEELAGPEIGTIIGGWRDLIGSIELRGAGANNPTYSAITGLGGLFAYEFHPTLTKEVWTTYHIDHDFKMGSKVYLHTHWLNSAATPNTGTVRWGFEYSVAKGHQQQAFHAPTTVYVTQNCSATRYMHHIAEVSLTDAIPATNLEVDALILVRIFRDAATDTCSDAVHLLLADCHYEADRMATLNKAPNFYTTP